MIRHVSGYIQALLQPDFLAQVFGTTYSFNFSLNASETLPLERSHGSYKGYRVDKRTEGLVKQKLPRGIALVQVFLSCRCMVGVSRKFLLEEVLPKDVGRTRYEGEDDEGEKGSNVDAIGSLSIN